MTTKDTTSTGLQRALEMEQVPKEKWTTMVSRTVIGVVINATGGFLLFKELMREDRSTMLVIVGVVAVVVGCTVWSTQIVARALKALINPAKAIRALLKGGEGT